MAADALPALQPLQDHRLQRSEPLCVRNELPLDSPAGQSDGQQGHMAARPQEGVHAPLHHAYDGRHLLPPAQHVRNCGRRRRHPARSHRPQRTKRSFPHAGGGQAVRPFRDLGRQTSRCGQPYDTDVLLAQVRSYAPALPQWTHLQFLFQRCTRQCAWCGAADKLPLEEVRLRSRRNISEVKCGAQKLRHRVQLVRGTPDVPARMGVERTAHLSSHYAVAGLRRGASHREILYAL